MKPIFPINGGDFSIIIQSNESIISFNGGVEKMLSKTTSIQKDILRTLMPPMVIEEIKSPLTGWKGSGMLWIGRVAKRRGCERPGFL